MKNVLKISQNPSNDLQIAQATLHDQFTKIGKSQELKSKMLEGYGYDQTQFKKDNKKFWDTLENPWIERILKSIPALDQSQARDSSIPKDWPSGPAAEKPKKTDVDYYPGLGFAPKIPKA